MHQSTRTTAIALAGALLAALLATASASALTGTGGSAGLPAGGLAATSATSPVPLSSTATYDLSFTNIVGSPLELGGFDTTFPSQVSIVTASVPATCDHDGAQTVSCPIGFVLPGESVNYLVDIVGNELGLDLPITMVSSNEIGTFTGGGEIDVIDPAVNTEVHPMLESLAQVGSGDPFLIEGSVVNSGRTTITDTTVDITVADSLRVDAIGLPCDLEATPIRCTIGEMSPWSQRTFSIALTPLGNDPVAFVTASVATTSAEDDPDPVPNATTSTFELVDSMPNLSVLLAGEDTFARLEPTQFFLTTRALGEVTAFGSELEVIVPDGVEILGLTRRVLANQVEPPNVTPCVIADQVATCGTGDMGGRANIGSYLLLIQASDTAAVDGTIVATVESTGTDSDPTDNQATDSYTLLEPGIDLSIRLRPLPGDYAVDAPAVLDWSVGNAGPSSLRDVEITVTADPGWMFAPTSFRFEPCEIAANTVTCPFGDPIAGSLSLFTQATPTVVGRGQTLRFDLDADRSDPDITFPITTTVDVGDYALVTTTSLTPSECDILDRLGSALGIGDRRDTIRRVVALLAGVDTPAATAGGLTVDANAEDCAFRVGFGDALADGIDTLAADIGIPAEDVPAAAGRFIIAVIVSLLS